MDLYGRSTAQLGNLHCFKYKYILSGILHSCDSKLFVPITGLLTVKRLLYVAYGNRLNDKEVDADFRGC